MKLDDFLKVEKVRCVKAYGDCLTVGKEYSVLDIRMEVKVKDDEGDNYYWESDHFEPVLDSAENPLQNIELTPEFETEASEPKFKVGDPVYCPSLLDGRIYKARENDRYLNDGCKLFVANEHEDCFDFEVDGSNQYNNPIVYHANEETRQALQVLHPHIEFEKPPTQADIDNEAVDKLAQAMKDKLAEKREQGYHGWETCKHSELVQLLINHVDKGDPIDVANFCAFLFARGEPLTEAVLGE